MKQLISHEGMHCANCGATMQGEFCHECGQSIHSVLKPVHHMAVETVETVLHIDSRIVHTLPPLLLKPGFLTLEYFSGRRVRYIAPFRLMFVLCLLSFFVFHLAINRIAGMIPANGQPLISIDTGSINTAGSPAEVRKALQEELDGLQNAGNIAFLPQNLRDQIDKDRQTLREKASQRLVELGAAPLSAASIAAPLSMTPVRSAATPKVDNAAPDKLRHPAIQQPLQTVHITWLPEAVNARLTTLVGQSQKNWRAFKDGDTATSADAKQRMISGAFGALPPTMFVMIPLFAAILKLFYIFRRRLYIEHLIVALHSHAFMFLSLLLITAAGMLSTWLRPHAAWVGYAVGYVQGLLICWVPIYLLLMQKRVYHQGWPMTLLKFWFIGWCYFWLVLLALTIAAALGMAH